MTLRAMERPEEAPTVRLWLRLLASANAIEGRLRGRLQERYSMTMPRFDALAQLAREPDGMTMGRLSQRMMVTKGNITGLVERLIADGLVLRSRDPRDGRSAIVRLSDQGRQRFDEIAPQMRRWIGELFSGLDGAQQQQMYDLLDGLRSSVEDKQGPG